jgi:hypothetical protein
MFIGPDPSQELVESLSSEVNELTKTMRLHEIAMRIPRLDTVAANSVMFI